MQEKLMRYRPSPTETSIRFARTEVMIKLNIDEPAPGQYFWRVVESDARGQQQQILRCADECANSYELALASGQLALKAAMRQGAERAPRPG